MVNALFLGMGATSLTEILDKLYTRLPKRGNHDHNHYLQKEFDHGSLALYIYIRVCVCVHSLLYMHDMETVHVCIHAGPLGMSLGAQLIKSILLE